MKEKVIIMILLLSAILTVQAEAMPVSDDILQTVPDEAEELLDELDTETYDHNTLTQGLGLMWDKVCRLFLSTVKDSVGGAVLILGVVLLCGVVDDCFAAAGNEKCPDYVPMAGTLAITLIAAGNMRSLIGLGTETVEELSVFAKALLPTLAAAVAAGGGMISAGVKQVATVFFADLQLSLMQNILLPLVYCYIAAAAMDAMLVNARLKKIAEGLRKAVTWVLTGSLALFTGYLTLSGSITGSADALTAQLARSAIATAVPVVGGIISDATGTVLAGATVLKNGIGIFGMLIVLAICLLPFLRLGVQYLLYKLTAFLSAAVGAQSLVDLVDALGSAFGLVLGMVGTGALLLLISIASSVSVVVT